jgi:hypothetical protein
MENNSHHVLIYCMVLDSRQEIARTSTYELVNLYSRYTYIYIYIYIHVRLAWTCAMIVPNRMRAQCQRLGEVDPYLLRLQAIQLVRAIKDACDLPPDRVCVHAFYDKEGKYSCFFF